MRASAADPRQGACARRASRPSRNPCRRRRARAARSYAARRPSLRAVPRSYEILEVRREAAEERAPDDEQRDGDGDSDRVAPLQRDISVEQAVAQAADEPAERIRLD